MIMSNSALRQSFSFCGIAKYFGIDDLWLTDGRQSIDMRPATYNL
jgi:hypothetical protein